MSKVPQDPDLLEALRASAQVRPDHMPRETAEQVTIRVLKSALEQVVFDDLPRLMAGYFLNAPERADAKIVTAQTRALLTRLEMPK